jgi:hypothetical protein
MKKLICLAMCVVMLLMLCACAGKKPSGSAEAPSQETQTAAEWSRDGYYQDDDGHMLSVTWMDDTVEPGWYVGCCLGEDFIEDSWGGMLPQEGNALRGTLPSSGGKDPLTVTVTEEDPDGLLLSVDGGETYHFKPMSMQEATIIVTVNTEGMGNIDYAEGEEAPEIDPEYPYQSAQINLAEPTTHTFVAWPQAGNIFVKWTKNGEDFSTEPQITVLLDESADFVAVFEEDPDWQNPVMNFVGNYQCGGMSALVECFGNEDAWITIEESKSPTELTRWDITGRLDLDTLTLDYTGCTKSTVVTDENGEVVSQEEVDADGSGTVVFGDDGTFTWHEDGSEDDAGLVFDWKPVEIDE